MSDHQTYQYDLEAIAQIVLDEFPERITLEDGETTLARKILVIDSASNQVSSASETGTPTIISHYGNKQESEYFLKQFLNILDGNLGPTYSKANKKIYHNKKTWKENKWDEMQTEGLIYVTYCSNDSDSIPLLFMSFMITEETGVIEDITSTCSVLYLYEIQLESQVQKQKLGTRLLEVHLVRCCSSFKEKIKLSYPMVGIQLTVFSDNVNAIQFYHAIGMKLTEDSPRDEVIVMQPRKTRSFGTKGLPSRKIVQKPVYYLYILTL